MSQDGIDPIDHGPSWEDRIAGLDEQARAVKEGRTWQGRIVSIVDSTAGEIFAGADGKKPVKNPERDVIVIAVQLDDGEKFQTTFSLPASPKAWYNDKFKLGQYRKRYGKLPQVGDAVTVYIDGDGFYRIML